MHLALYQPDIPQNLGSVLRLCACMGVVCHIIEPCGFPLDDKRIRRAGMDYIDHVQWHRHASWHTFQGYMEQAGLRSILLTTKVTTPYTSVAYTENDVVILGRESAGVPQDVANACNLRVTIPMHGKMRSLNVALSAAIVVARAVAQNQNLPGPDGR